MPLEQLRHIDGLREPQRLSDQLSTLLAAEIVSGRIAVGEAFPSADEIVNRFGVSRTVARETVQALAMLGLVRVQHGKRTEVCAADDWDILSSVVQEALRREGLAEPLLRDLYEFRLLIEPQAAAWMAEHGSDDDLARLDEITTTIDRLAGGDAAVAELMERGPRLPRPGRPREREPDRRRGQQGHPRGARHPVGLSALGADQARIVAGQHRAIADAIGRRDADEAAAAMRRHLQWAEGADLQGRREPARPGGPELDGCQAPRWGSSSGSIRAGRSRTWSCSTRRPAGSSRSRRRRCRARPARRS